MLIALRDAQGDVDVVRALVRHDPDERDPRTTAALDALGDPYTREHAVEYALDVLEAAEREVRRGA